MVAATNGRHHLRELHEVEASVFGEDALDRTLEVFGAETGFDLLREQFADVRWLQYEDELRCTEPADVLAYSCSSPPGEDATPDQRAALAAAIQARFDAGGALSLRLARFLIGVIGLLVLWRGLPLILPKEPETIALTFRFIRYALMTWWIAFLAPWLFLKSNLARPEQANSAEIIATT